jgi:hypothetical protein
MTISSPAARNDSTLAFVMPLERLPKDSMLPIFSSFSIDEKSAKSALEKSFVILQDFFRNSCLVIDGFFAF